MMSCHSSLNLPPFVRANMMMSCHSSLNLPLFVRANLMMSCHSHLATLCQGQHDDVVSPSLILPLFVRANILYKVKAELGRVGLFKPDVKQTLKFHVTQLASPIAQPLHEGLALRCFEASLKLHCTCALTMNDHE
jgi:hypothetical protein